MDSLPASAARVQMAANALGLAIKVRIMAETARGAVEAAAACGCSVGQIVKSLVFQGNDSGRAILLLVSGANRVNQAAVAVHLGEAIGRPDAAYVRQVTGYAIGGVPPFGHATALVPYLDADLLQYETVWAAAGTPNAVFPVDPARLRDATGAEVIRMR